jgi:hypothetical protein
MARPACLERLLSDQPCGIVKTESLRLSGRVESDILQSIFPPSDEPARIGSCRAFQGCVGVELPDGFAFRAHATGRLHRAEWGASIAKSLTAFTVSGECGLQQLADASPRAEALPS